MKILEITRSYYPSIGGLEKFILQRTKIYRQLNIDFHIIASDYSSEKTDNSLKYDNVTVLKQFTKYNFVFGLKKDFFLSYDFIFINQIGNFLSDRSIFIASGLNKKIILTPHLYFHTNDFSLLKSIHKKYITPMLLKRVDKIICFTNYEKEYWSTNFYVPAEKLVVIPHYFKQEMQKKLNFTPAPGKFLLYLGRNYKNKRIDLLITAFTRMKQLTFDLYLTASLRDFNPGLKRLITKDGRIKLLDYISESDKHKLLSACTALILPTDNEAFGSVCLEGAGFEKPLLCSNLPVLREINDKDGVIFFDNNLLSIKNALEKLDSLTDQKLKTMGLINYNNLKKYEFEKILRMYEVILKY